MFSMIKARAFARRRRARMGRAVVEAATAEAAGEATSSDASLGESGDDSGDGGERAAKGLVAEFVRELGDDGTLRRLELAAERLRTETTRDAARLRSERARDRSSLDVAPGDRRKEASEKLLKYLENSERSSSASSWRSETVLIAPKNTAIEVRLSGGSSSPSTILSAPSNESESDRILSLTSTRSLAENPGRPAMVTPTRAERMVTPTPSQTPTLLRSKAVRVRQLSHISSDEEVTNEFTAHTPAYTPPDHKSSIAAIPCNSLGNLATHMHLSSSSENLIEENSRSERRRTSFDTVFPVELRAQIHEILGEIPRFTNRAFEEKESDVDEDEVWSAMLRFRVSDLPRRARTPIATSNTTIGMNLLRCVDAKSQALDGELVRLAYRLKIAEKEVRAKSLLVREAVHAIPSERLRGAFVQLHELSLDATLRHGFVRQLESHLSRLNVILADPRLRRPPETASDAFDWACALGLQGRLDET